MSHILKEISDFCLALPFNGVADDLVFDDAKAFEHMITEGVLLTVNFQFL